MRIYISNTPHSTLQSGQTEFSFSAPNVTRMSFNENKELASALREVADMIEAKATTIKRDEDI